MILGLVQVRSLGHRTLSRQSPSADPVPRCIRRMTARLQRRRPIMGSLHGSRTAHGGHEPGRAALPRRLRGWLSGSSALPSGGRGSWKVVREGSSDRKHDALAQDGSGRRDCQMIRCDPKQFMGNTALPTRSGGATAVSTRQTSACRPTVARRRGSCAGHTRRRSRCPEWPET
jgi:hypothetical protein